MEEVALAGVSPDSLQSHRRITARLKLPFPLISDPDREAASQLHLVRKIGLGGWTIEIFRRVTLLVDAQGQLAAVWGQVKIRGHAREVLEAARALRSIPPVSPSPPSA